MSVWNDIRKKSLGVQDRKEDHVEGMWEITRMSEELKVSRYGKIKFDSWKAEYMAYKINWRVMDKYHGERYQWYRFYNNIVFKNCIYAWKGLAKEVFNDMMASMEKRLGKFDGITGKDGNISWTEKNERRHMYLYNMVQMWNCAQMGVKFQEDLDNKWYDYYLNCFLGDIVVKYDKYIPDYEEEQIIK